MGWVAQASMKTWELSTVERKVPLKLETAPNTVDDHRGNDGSGVSQSSAIEC